MEHFDRLEVARRIFENAEADVKRTKQILAGFIASDSPKAAIEAATRLLKTHMQFRDRAKRDLEGLGC